MVWYRHGHGVRAEVWWLRMFVLFYFKINEALTRCGAVALFEANIPN